jgi:hypothetical protein
MSFDWNAPVQGYTETQAARKRSFHATARSRLRMLADALYLPKGSYDIRTNAAGVAVSGEVTMHSENIYVQVSRGILGASHGVMFRTCKGRKDYTGGRNNFAPLWFLDDTDKLASKINFVLLNAK